MPRDHRICGVLREGLRVIELRRASPGVASGRAGWSVHTAPQVGCIDTNSKVFGSIGGFVR